MNREYKAILVTRRTRYQELLAQYNTEAQAEFVIQSRGGDFAEYRSEHDVYYAAIQEVEAELNRSARVQRIEREFLPNFIFNTEDIVVVVGQDGLVANTLKYLNGQPLIAINPDPKRFDGIILPFRTKDVATVFSDVTKGTYQIQPITMAQAKLNDGQELLAVNDLFIGPRYQTSARYTLMVGKETEQQSSSGVIVSTGLGSTGWLNSVVTGAKQIMYMRQVVDNTFSWDSDYLRYAVREPFPSRTTGTELVFGNINAKSTMTIASHIPNNGVIFSDGMVDDYIEFNIGDSVEIKTANRHGLLVM